MNKKTPDEPLKDRRDFYREFQEEEGIPVYRVNHINLHTVELGPWPRMGGLGAYVNIFGEELMSDNYVCEIPPGQSLNPQRHLFEEYIYVISGRGATTFWSKEGGPKWTFEWQEQSLFALPANIGYQHFNGDAARPARLLGKTNLPALFRYFRNKQFIFENDYVFEEVEKDFYSAEAKTYYDKAGDKRINWVANFVPDVRGFEKMTNRQERGAGDRSVRFHPTALASMFAHQSEFPVGTYKKAHAHPSGRTIIIITGTGYSQLWQPGHEKEKIKVDWQPGTAIGVALFDLPGEIWFHQHFNTGKEPARYLALHNNDPQDKHVQIEYVDEDPEVRKFYESELAKSGLKSKMPPECYVDPDFKWKHKA